MGNTNRFNRTDRFDHFRNSEYEYENELYVDDQCCQNCRYWCDWDQNPGEIGCKNYGREGYRKRPKSKWCMDWKGKGRRNGKGGRY